MQTKNLITIGFFAAILITGVLMLSISTTNAEKATCCKKNLKKCSGEKKTSVPAETNLENLSHQFISFPAFIY
jgi:hypothetical protein